MEQTYLNSEFNLKLNKLVYFQINAIYGKCLENVKKYRQVKLVSSQQFGQKWANKSKVRSFTIIDKDLVCVDMIKEEVKLCKPVYAGMVCYRYLAEI